RYDDQLTFWVSEADRGQTDAINKGLRRATGDVIAYINSDDYYLPGAFAAATDALARNPAALWAAGSCRYVDADDQLQEVWRPTMPYSEHRWIWVLAPWGVP